VNILEAKKQIKNTLNVYFSKDEYNSPLIEVNAQRPLILMGPPGIGKTEIMAQIASEMKIALVSYSMTHHTRQSVLGLPVIVEKEYGKVSEYTMSEILAELYETSKKNNLSKGILFLDEINCVSETLMPTMLQFLQYKKLGQHSVPDGWLIVAAGNPQEYNHNARDFDVVTWDRLKRIDIEPDYQVWKQFLAKKGGHGSIITYLDIKKENFYRYESTVDGTKFVTARAWDDLSDAIIAYEKLGLEVDLNLVEQYLQYVEVAEDFYNYYCLYKKYEADYEVDSILNGAYSKAIAKRASDASFDERYSLIGLILNSLTKKIKLTNDDEDYIRHLLDDLKLVKQGEDINTLAIKENEKRERLRKMQLLTISKNKEFERVISFLSEHLSVEFNTIKNDYDMSLVVLQDNTNAIIANIENIFKFIEEVFGVKEEMTIFVTELTVNYYSAHFIARHEVESYTKYSNVLSLQERKLEINKQIENLDI